MDVKQEFFTIIKLHKQFAPDRNLNWLSRTQIRELQTKRKVAREELITHCKWLIGVLDASSPLTPDERLLLDFLTAFEYLVGSQDHGTAEGVISGVKLALSIGGVEWDNNNE